VEVGSLSLFFRSFFPFSLFSSSAIHATAAAAVAAANENI
jgi:hypothetical protein